jgi:hypothetical protein
MVWILVLNPPRERPMAWSSPAFLGAGTVLIGAHHGAVDHRIFVAGVRGKMLKNTLPDTGFCPAGKAPMRILPVAAACGQVAPGRTGAVADEDGCDEQAIIRRSNADRSGSARQTILEPLPLVVAQSIPAHWSAL